MRESDVSTWRASLAIAYASVGRDDEARDALRTLASTISHTSREPLVAPTLAVAAEAAWTVGEQACARPLRIALVPYIDHNTTLSTALALGPVARPYGLVQILDGDFDGAVATLERAVTLSREMGSPLWVAESRRVLVEALRVRDRKGDAARAVLLDAELDATDEQPEGEIVADMG